MSWLVSSIGTAIANSLNLDSDEDEDNSDSNTTNPSDQSPTSTTGKAPNPNSDNTQQTDLSADQTAQPRGVKEDLSELSQTLTRQLWGVASFLAPPPQISARDPNSDDPDRITGIRNDLSEIGGKFRTRISKISGNIDVSEFTKIASNLLQIGLGENLTVEEYAQRGVVGVTEEVVAFARDAALHPETWLDFPLPDGDDDGDEEDFDLSDAQQEHVLAVECLVPELAALRSEICLGYMSEASFWKIYFVLLHPRLSKHDALVLSTPEIVNARAMLSQELRNRSKSMPYEPRSTNASGDTTRLSYEQMSVPITDNSEAVPVEISVVEPTSYVDDDLEIDKHPVTCTVIPVVEKSVIDEDSTKQTNTEQVSTKQENIEQVSTKPINVEEIPTNRINIEQLSAKLTNMEGVPTMQTTAEQVSTKLTNMDIAPTKQTNIEELPTKQARIPNPTACASKSVDPKDEYDADDWLKEENVEAVSFKGNSYPLGNDDEDDISFSDLEED